MRNNYELTARIRAFNRFYTNFIGVVDKHVLESPYSLTEARVLYEIAHIEDCSARKIIGSVDIDEGYLSRIIGKFMKKGLVMKSRSKKDRRKRIIVLTRKGNKEFTKLDMDSSNSIHNAVEKLSLDERKHLVELMEQIHKLLTKA